MMSWPAIAEMQGIVQFAAGRMLNSVAAGTALAAGAWMLLRVTRRLNASTRFAVWFAVLLGVAALPLLGALRWGDAAGGPASASSLITLSGWWAICGLAVWAALAAIGLLRVGAGLGELRRLRRDSTPIELSDSDPELQNTLHRLRRFRAVKLCASERVKVPMAIGFLEPLVILPAWTLRELSAEELRSVLLHELAHLRRWDDWTALAQEVVRALFCFHPAVWWIGGRLSLEREMACDDMVLAQTENPRAYARCLVSVAEKSFLRRGVALAQAAVGRMRNTSLRVAQILAGNRPGATRVRKPALALVGAFFAICLLGLGRTPQLVAFRTEAPAGPMQAALAPAAAVAQAPSAVERVAPSDDFHAAAVPVLWQRAATTGPHATKLSPKRAVTIAKRPEALVAAAQKPAAAAALGLAVDLQPRTVVLILDAGPDAPAQVWRIDVYELTVFCPAGSAGRQPTSAKI